MPIEYNYPLDQIPFYLFVITVLLSLAAFTWQFRKTPGAKMQIYSQVSKGIWLLSIVMVSVNAGLDGKLYWMKLQYIAAIFSAYLWFEFIVQISEQDKKIPDMVRYGVWVVIVCLWLAILTNLGHWFLLKNVWLDGQTVRGITGSAFIATEIISYIFCALALVLSARCILITRGLRRRQALWFTLPCLFSLVGSVLNHIPAVQRVAPLPSGFLLSGLFITWGFHRWQAYNIIPLAHEVVVRNMIDGLMVVDAYGYIANMNSAAKTAMNGMSVAVGGRFAELATGWPALAAALANPGPGSAEVVRNYPGGSRYYQLTTTSLQTAGHFLGKIVIFKDITQQKQDQEKLLNSEKALSILTERNRLSRELHDAQGQFPGYVKTHTQAIRLLLQKGQIEDVDRQLERLTNAAAVAFTDVRESIIGLKTAVEEWDFFKNLQAWLSQFQQSSGIITSYTGPESRLPQWVLPEAEVQLLRIVQEALVNARKHSGADRAEVAFFVGNGNLIVTIADNGRGFDVAKINNSAGFGLEIIRERAEGIGSVCKISSAFDQGTVVTVEVPLVETPGEIAI